MKRYITILTALLMCIVTAKAQGAESQLSTRAVYIELGGPSVIYTFNYDFMFDKSKTDGWGMRVGIGASAANEFYFVSLPLMVNYLLGKDDNFFEISAGPVMTLGSEQIAYVDPEATPVIGTIYFGYRYQPDHQGFLFRAGVPLDIGSKRTYSWDGFNETTENKFYILPMYPGFSFGYSF